MGSGGLLSSTVASWRLTCEAGVVMDSVRSNVRAASCFVFEQQPFLLGAQLVHGLFVLTQTQFIHLPAALQRQQGGIFSALRQRPEILSRRDTSDLLTLCRTTHAYRMVK